MYLNLLDAIVSHLKSVVPTTNLKQYLYERLAIHAHIVDALASGDRELVASAVEAHRYTGSRLFAAARSAEDRLGMDS